MLTKLVVALALTAFTASLAKGQTDFIKRDYFVTSEPNIRIHVREVNTKATEEKKRVPILLVHGGDPASVACFDSTVPGYSVAEDFARAGHSVHLVDVRGWAESTRPKALDNASPDVAPRRPA